MKYQRLIGNIFMVIFSVIIGYCLFDQISLTRQYDMVKFLAAMSATVFAILGVWIAVLDPKGLFNVKVEEQQTAAQKLSFKLLYPWVYAIMVFMVTLVVTIILGVLEESHIDDVTIQRITGSVLTLCLFMLLDSILSTLIPVAVIQRDLRNKQLRERYRG